MNGRNPLAILNCANCGKPIEIFHKRRLEQKFVYCCKKCEGEYAKKISWSNRPENIIKCEVCGKEFYRKKSYKDKTKHPTCSYECFYKLRETTFLGNKNHQYGLKGNSNSSWKSDTKITNYGYVKIRVLNHPFADCDGFVFEHRLIAEEYLLTEDNSIEINDKKYLKKEYVVHHKDHNRLNNNLNNLEVILLSEHTSLHTKKLI